MRIRPVIPGALDRSIAPSSGQAESKAAAQPAGLGKLKTEGAARTPLRSGTRLASLRYQPRREQCRRTVACRRLEQHQ